MKFNYKKVFLLGFGFFAVSITWSVYNSFMPKLLNNFTQNAALIGFIMTIDNYLALFIQPAVGTYSDNHETRFGKRMPFLIIGMPAAAIFLFLIPQYTSLKSLILLLLFMNLSMSIFRAPVIALMPDITPLPLRSKANSIINMMGGIGAVIAYFLGAVLWNKNAAYPFYLSGILVIISLIVLVSNINEKRDSIKFDKNFESDNKINDDNTMEEKTDKKSIIFLFAAICFYFIAYQGIEAFFTLYGEKYLGISVGAAVTSFTFISLSFLIFAYPAGLIGTKFGKKKTMISGIIGLAAGFFLIALTKNILTIRMIFIFCGFCWALININSYPFVVQLAPAAKTGKLTGYYYFVSSVAAIVSPPLLGTLINSLSYRIVFFYGAVFFLISLFMMLNVKMEGK